MAEAERHAIGINAVMTLMDAGAGKKEYDDVVAAAVSAGEGSVSQYTRLHILQYEFLVVRPQKV